MPTDRALIWFSCGAASAIATKLAVEEFKHRKQIHIAYCDTGSEHPDNVRFLKDCEQFFGLPVHVYKSSKYADTWDVFTKMRYLSGPQGARCTTELKKKVRRSVENLDTDLQVFGFDYSETRRANNFVNNNPEVRTFFPLITYKLNKSDCLNILRKHGIEIPYMYKLGYRNNNCIGCVKGRSGYWNKIRVDFPDVFDRMAKLERELGASIIRHHYRQTGKTLRVFLDQLHPDEGTYEPLENISCGLLCD